MLRADSEFRFPQLDSTQLGGVRREPALFNNEARNLMDALAAFHVGKDKRPVRAHSQRVGFHDLKVGTYQGCQVNFVDDQKIGPRNARAAFARYFFALRNVDDIDGQVGELRAERCGEIVATRFDETQVGAGKFSFLFVDRREVDGGVFANRGVRTTSGLNTHDALRGKSFGARQDELVFLCIDVIRDYVDVVLVAKPLAEGF